VVFGCNRSLPARPAQARGLQVSKDLARSSRISAPRALVCASSAVCKPAAAVGAFFLEDLGWLQTLIGPRRQVPKPPARSRLTIAHGWSPVLLDQQFDARAAPTALWLNGLPPIEVLLPCRTPTCARGVGR